ncbi:MAG TPA: hypothetical protein VFZ59_07480 [Verrucomicrobiae bacterium]|nr:hypothetical protein [Verrucomicrobiae bacterium]
MKPDPIWKQVIAVFVAALIGYLVVFYFIEHQRRKDGPWQATFTTVDGLPTMLVSHPKLQLTNVSISFVDATTTATNLPQTVAFEHGRPAPFDLPFGQCVFIDALYMPGTAVFEMFGHQIQLMPRVLTIDKVERPWRSGEKILLTNQPSATLPAN